MGRCSNTWPSGRRLREAVAEAADTTSSQDPILPLLQGLVQVQSRFDPYLVNKYHTLLCEMLATGEEDEPSAAEAWFHEATIDDMFQAL